MLALLSQHRLQGSVSTAQLAAAGALLGGCGIASTSLWFFSRRYIGELSVVPRLAGPGSQPAGTEPVQQFDSSKVLISTLDFWGHRQVLPLQGLKMLICMGVCWSQSPAMQHANSLMPSHGSSLSLHSRTAHARSGCNEALYLA